MKFGMTPDEVREVLGADFESDFRGAPEEGEHPHDYFEELGCFVYYDSEGKAEAVEFCEPAEPMIGDVNLLGLSFEDLAGRISALDEDVVMDGEGFTSVLLGVGCYAPLAEEEPESPPEGIIVFARGYYDD